MFESNIINIYGKKGQQWLGDLPKLITQVEVTYGLSNLKPVEAFRQQKHTHAFKSGALRTKRV